MLGHMVSDFHNFSDPLPAITLAGTTDNRGKVGEGLTVSRLVQ